MSLIDDTCDHCGKRYDPMGDPMLYRHPEIGPWAVLCGACEQNGVLTTDTDEAE